MTNGALLLMSFSAASLLVCPALCQDPTAKTETTTPPQEASIGSAELTSQEDKEAGSNRILNYGENVVGGSGFGIYPGTGSQILPTNEYPVQPSQYPAYSYKPDHGYNNNPYQPLNQGHGSGYIHNQYKNFGCKHYCPGFYPGSFYCCNKSPSYGGYYCPRTRQSCPASSRHRAPRSCVEDRDCHHGQKCCLDACLRYHVCKATSWL